STLRATCGSHLMRMFSGRRRRKSNEKCQCLLNDDTLDTKGTEIWFCYIACCNTFVRNRAPNMKNLIHTVEKPYACTVCDRQYSHRQSLQRHKKLTHTDKLIPNKFIDWTFKYDKYQLKTEADLEARILANTKNKKPFACTMCSFKSRKISTLKTHLMLYSEENSKHCLYCGKEYPSKEKLLIHLITHLDDKPFSCSECEQKFQLQSSLLKHFMDHRKSIQIIE
ncbi:unnamed protein product, partial [Meganyctiphanes norvegica]